MYNNKKIYLHRAILFICIANQTTALLWYIHTHSYAQIKILKKKPYYMC